MIFPSLHLQIERWKFNKDYGVYVSTLGNFKDRYKRRLPINITNKGYCTVKTEAAGIWPKAHRLVMLTWKPIPNAENLTVDHLNHNKRDNSLANLEWVTKEENFRRAKEDYIAINAQNKIVSVGSHKVLSIFSPKVPLEEYQKQLKGYSIKGVKCLSQDDIYKQIIKYCNKPEEELRVMIADIVKRIDNRHSGLAGIRIKKGLVIEPIFEKTMIVIQKDCAYNKYFQERIDNLRNKGIEI